MGYELRTRDGYNMFDMASMMQKAIRRGDWDHAAFAAYQLFGPFNTFMWKRLLVISVEDCWGIMTKEIVALKMAEDMADKNKKGYDRDPIFAAKAIVLLCQARKNRDACYLACNYMLPERTLEPEEIAHIDISDIKLDHEIPDWVFDIHTLKGKAAGRTDLDMIISEQNALTPLQVGLFDNADWQPYMSMREKKGDLKGKEAAAYEMFKRGKVNPEARGTE